jgi:phosphoenolpyruvate carboxylase
MLYALFRLGGSMKNILDQMEEHIAAIRNLQRNFDFHSKRLEKLMLHLHNYHNEKDESDDSEFQECDVKK